LLVFFFFPLLIFFPRRPAPPVRKIFLLSSLVTTSRGVRFTCISPFHTGGGNFPYFSLELPSPQALHYFFSLAPPFFALIFRSPCSTCTSWLFPVPPPMSSAMVTPRSRVTFVFWSMLCLVPPILLRGGARRCFRASPDNYPEPAMDGLFLNPPFFS